MNPIKKNFKNPVLNLKSTFWIDSCQTECFVQPWKRPQRWLERIKCDRRWSGKPFVLQCQWSHLVTARHFRVLLSSRWWRIQNSCVAFVTFFQNDSPVRPLIFHQRILKTDHRDVALETQQSSCLLRSFHRWRRSSTAHAAVHHSIICPSRAMRLSQAETHEVWLKTGVEVISRGGSIAQISALNSRSSILPIDRRRANPSPMERALADGLGISVNFIASFTHKEVGGARARLWKRKQLLRLANDGCCCGCCC